MTRRELVLRLIYGSSAIALLVVLFLVDAWLARESASASGLQAALFRHGSAIPLLTLIVLLSGAAELTGMLRAKGARPYGELVCLSVALLVLGPWAAAAAGSFTGHHLAFKLVQVDVLLALAMLGTSVFSVVMRRTDEVLRDTAATWMIILYAGFLGSFATRLRCDPHLPVNQGLWLLLLIVLAAKASDIGALFVGSAIGRHKLIPRISPAKSIEGAIGGLAASALVMAGATALGMALGQSTGPALEVGSPSDWGLAGALGALAQGSTAGAMARAIVLGLAISVFSQIGDLLESSFKRDVHFKDSARIIPVLGGILDLIDSVVLTLPVAWLLLFLAGIVV